MSLREVIRYKPETMLIITLNKRLFFFYYDTFPLVCQEEFSEKSVFFADETAVTGMGAAIRGQGEPALTDVTGNGVEEAFAFRGY